MGSANVSGKINAAAHQIRSPLPKGHPPMTDLLARVDALTAAVEREANHE